MNWTSRVETLHLARTFTISSSSKDVEQVLVVSLEHDGITGYGEGAPVNYWGESLETMQAFVDSGAVHDAIGDDPFALEAIGARLAALGTGGDADTGAKMALDGALHDWLGKRLGQPVWRLLGLSRVPPPTSFTIGIDSVAGTVERTREAAGFEVLKIKVGGPDDLERLRAVRTLSNAGCGSTATRAGPGTPPVSSCRCWWRWGSSSSSSRSRWPTAIPTAACASCPPGSRW